MCDHNVRHEFTDVDLLTGEERKAVLDEIRRYNPNCSFPTILIGDRVLVGYNEKSIIEALEL
jgi:glutaredoxin